MIVAINAFAVSIMSLLLTVKVTETDREYEEVTIRPALALIVDPEELSIKLVNRGIGPALISRVVAEAGDICIEASSLGEMKNLTPKFLDAMLQWLALMNYQSRRSELVWFDLAADVAIMNYPSPGDVLGVNEKIIFFSFKGDRFWKGFAALPLDAANKLKLQFANHSAGIPIAVRYCTMTGRTCFDSGQPHLFNGCKRK